MHLDEMLCVDRCLDMDELIKLLSPIRIIVRMPEPDCFLQYRIGYGTLHFAALPRLPASCAAMRIFTSGENHMYTYWRRGARASGGFKMVLFPEPSEDLCQR